MMDLDFTFEKSPWEAFLGAKNTGEYVSAARLLAMLAEEDDESVEDAFRYAEERELLLDISDMPKAAGNGSTAVRLRQEEQLVHNGLNLRELNDNDPLRLYLEEISLMHFTEEESALAAKCVAGDEKAKTALTNAGIRRVVELAKEYVGYGVLLMDLIQEGSLGLWQAIQNYRGGDYAVIRDRWICNAMAKAICLQARSNGISQKMREAMEDYRAVDERLLAELGRNATVEEIALELHMSPEETETVRKMLADAQLVRQAVKEQEPEETNPEDEQAVEDTAYFQARQRIMELLSTLSEEDAKLLTLRFGLEKGLPLSPEETGKRLGLTPDEVVAREANALAMLRRQEH